MRGISVGVAIVFAAAWTSLASAQQYFVKQTAEQCAAKGGQIVVWTNTYGVGTPVGECYVPPKVSGSGAASGFSGGGYSGGGGNRAALAFGAVGAFLGLLSSLVEQSQRHEASTPTPTYDFYNSEEYRRYQRELALQNAALNRQTGELQDFVRAGRGQRGTISGDQCRGYPASRAGVAMCQSDIAATLEQQAAACTDQDCRGAFLKAAATARCTAGFRPSPEHVETATGHCGRFPGDYARLQQQILQEFPWANDPDRAGDVVRDPRLAIKKKERERRARGQGTDVDVTIEHYDGGRLVHRYDATIDSRCVDANFAPTICDLAWKAKEARERGWLPDTPFNCGRARGEWEGDIVNGRCRLPGSRQKPYNPRDYLQRDAKLMQWQADEAVRLWQEGDVREALSYARLAEQTFATMLGLTTTMDAETRALVVGAGLSEIERVVAALQ